LIESKEIRFNLFFSKKEFKGIKISKYKESLRLKPSLVNLSLFGKIIWQLGVVNSVIKSRADGLMFLGEMNLLSTWVSVLICKIMNKKVFFWGHGIYGSESFIKMKLRLIFLNLADINFLYGNHAKNILVKNGFKKDKIQVIYNSIPSTSNNEAYSDSVNNYKETHNMLADDILFVGRLTKTKKIELLFQAFEKAKKINSKLRLFVIGSGEIRTKLEKKFYHLNKSIFFLGAIYNEKILEYYISNSSLFVSPGNVGLACIHSLSYGTPVCTHNNMDFQMPEAEVLDEKNSVLFERDNIDSLVNSILKGVDIKKKKNTSQYCKESVLKNFTPENQYKLIIDKIHEAL
jgi:glycosyltransferase involved in cell wall biosynthesis